MARDFILFGQPDVTIVVVDATQLERNLNLALQVLEITDRVVVCLNLMDEARRHGLEVDDRALARRLGVPVVPTAARYRGCPDCRRSWDVATGRVCKPRRLRNEPPALKHAVSTLVRQIHALYPGLPNARWVALRLLDGDESITAALRNGELGDLTRGEPVPIETAHPIELEMAR